MSKRGSDDVDDVDSTIEVRLNGLLAAMDGQLSPLTLAAAESCTGGNVCARITSVAGASDYFRGGIVAYANETKVTLLAVSQEVLDTRGAVSAECARQMAEGARRALRVDLAVSTTGIAGPGGATARKPVGLVYIALAAPDGTHVEEFHFPGGRAVVTDAATEAALLMLLRGVERLLA